MIAELVKRGEAFGIMRAATFGSRAISLAVFESCGHYVTRLFGRLGLELLFRDPETNGSIWPESLASVET